MRELSLHLLDIAENSVAAKARNITILVEENLATDRLIMSVEDDGTGMNAEMAAKVLDPFTTSRTTRKVGLGLPLLKAAAEGCNGGLTLASTPGKGTKITVEFQRSHIDRMPLGDLAATLLALIVSSPEIHWLFHYKVNQDAFVFDDAVVKDQLDGLPLSEPSVLHFLRTFLDSGIAQLQPADSRF